MPILPPGGAGGGMLAAPPFLKGPPFAARPLATGKTAVSAPPRGIFMVGDRVKDIVASLTPSLVTLAKANPAGFSNFQDGVGDGNATTYVLQDTAGNYEVQYGVYTDAAGTLTRSVPLDSNAPPGQQTTFTGQVTVFVDWPASALMGGAYGLLPGRYYGSYAHTAKGGGGYNSQPFLKTTFAPFYIAQGFSSVQLGISLGGGASCSWDIGLYSTLGGAPFSLLALQTGLSGSIGLQITAPISIASPQMPGWYWMAHLCQSRAGASSVWTTSSACLPLLGSPGTATDGASGYSYSGQSALPSIVPQNLLLADTQSVQAFASVGV